jgi:carboxyl-terminal processing protease
MRKPWLAHEQEAERGGGPAQAPAGRVLAYMALTAALTAVAVVALLRLLGVLGFTDAVIFGGDAHDRASVRKLQQVWNYISQDFYEQPDEDAMLESAAAALASSVGDAYTAYYTEAEMRGLNEHSSGAFYGIGVTVAAADSGRLKIVDVFDGSPAQKAGVMADDEIVRVEGVDVGALDGSQAVIDMIKGERNTKVRVAFYRPSDDSVLEFVMERDEVRTENVFSELLDGEIGYIRLVMFDSSADKYFGQHLSALLDGGIKGLIVDLRDNPGGSYDECVKIADRLVGEGTIVYTEDRGGNREYRRSDANKLDVPLALLTNAFSASASEILAGAVKDNGDGTLVGKKTFGKGLVQAVVTLADGAGLKYTRSRYFTPNGVCIQGYGIEPDIDVDMPAEFDRVAPADVPAEDDAQLQAAMAEIRRQGSEAGDL